MLSVSPILFAFTLIAIVTYQAVSTYSLAYLQTTYGLTLTDAQQTRQRQYFINLVSNIAIAVGVFSLAQTLDMINVPLWVALMVPTGYEIVGRIFHKDDPRASQTFAWTLTGLLVVCSVLLRFM